MKKLVSGLFSSISDAELFAATMGSDDLENNEVSDGAGVASGTARSSDNGPQ